MAAIVNSVLIQGNSVSTINTSTSPITTTAGNLLVADISFFGTFQGFTDNNNEEWQLAHVVTGSGGNYVRQYFCENIKGRSGHTFTFTMTGNGWPTLAVKEISGVAKTGSLDKKAGAADGGNTTSHSSGTTATRSQAAEILCGVAGAEAGGPATTFAATGSFSADQNQPSTGSFQGLLSASRIVSSTGTDAFTFTTGTSCDCQMAVSAFRLDTDMSFLPYALSSAIARWTLDWSTHNRQVAGSDNWPVTWADDGAQYTSWGDGPAFGGGGPYSLGIAKITSASPPATGVDVNTNPTGADGKTYGIICISGVLYMWVSPGSDATNYTAMKLYSSANHGTSWTPASWQFTSSDGICLPCILQFGQDYAGALDGYLYTYAINIKDSSALKVQIPGELVLMRCPVGSIMTQAAWEFFSGSSGSPAWTSTLASRVPVFSDANGVGWSVSAAYNPNSGRYLLMTEHTTSFLGKMGIFDAPTPWGPWTTVRYDTWLGSSTITEDVFYMNLANKWSSGNNFVIIFSGIGTNDSYNSVNGAMVLGAAQVTGEARMTDDFFPKPFLRIPLKAGRLK